MIPDHPVVVQLMRDGELGYPPKFKCKECGCGIYSESYMLGGRCEDCFDGWVHMHRLEVAAALGLEIIEVEED